MYSRPHQKTVHSIGGEAVIRHFVALGDSFTEGIGDPDNGHRGAENIADPVGMGHGSLRLPIPLRSAQDWIALWMQSADPAIKYTNLALRGLRAGEVRSQQLQRALNLNPDLVSIIAGANDCLRGPFSADGVKAELALMFGAFHSIGARILTSTLPDFTLNLELPPTILGRLRHNLETTNQIIAELARRHGAIFLDFRHYGLEQQRGLWSEDGIHPNALGYLEIARALMQLLESHGIVKAEVA
jgi:lysophospholipase L1-like esterase